MRPMMKIVALAGVIASSTAWMSGRSGFAGAQENPEAARSARGGLLVKTSRNRFEVFFYPTGVRVFPQDYAGAAAGASNLAGTATFYHPVAPERPWFSRPLHPGVESLDVAIDLSAAPASRVRVAFEVTGLADPSERRAVFVVPLEMAAQPVAPPAAPAAAAVGPRYVYGPGYYGYGYYSYPGPELAPQPSAGAPIYQGSPPAHRSGSMAGHSVGPRHRDWSSGRDSPLAKPWLSPRD